MTGTRADNPGDLDLLAGARSMDFRCRLTATSEAGHEYDGPRMWFAYSW